MEPLAQIIWNILVKEVPKVPLTEDDEMIQILCPNRANSGLRYRTPSVERCREVPWSRPRTRTQRRPRGKM